MDIIGKDLSLIVLQEEYPKIKDLLSIKASDIGYSEIQRYINEISEAAFTASRLVARMEHEYMEFKEVQFDVAMAQWKDEALTELEKKHKEEKLKATLTEKRTDDYILIKHRDEILKMKERERWFKRNISVLKSLYKRLEMRETLSQTYARLQEKRTEIVFRQNSDKGETP